MYTPNQQMYVGQMPRYSAYDPPTQPYMYQQPQQPIYQQQHMNWQQPQQMYGQSQPMYQQQVPPTVGGNIETGPATPGYHNSNYPQMNMGYNYNNQPFMNTPGYSPFANNIGNQGYNPYEYHGMYAQPQAHDQIVTIPGAASNMSPLVTQQDIDEVNQLHSQMMDEIEDAYENQNNYIKNMYQYNYYGQNQISWTVAGIQSKYNQKVYEIIDRAKNRRKEFEKKLYINAARAKGHEVTEDELNDVFEDKQIIIPAKQVQSNARLMSLNNYHEIDTSDPRSNPYLAHDIEVSTVFKKLTGENPNMNEFFRNVGNLVMYNNFLKGREQRRNYRKLYTAERSFKDLIKKRKTEQDQNGAQEYNKMKDLINSRIDLSADEDTKRTQAAGLLADLVDARENGTQIGSFMNRMAKIGRFENGVFTLNEPPDFSATEENTNAMESEYDQNRDAFITSIYASGGGNTV